MTTIPIFAWSQRTTDPDSVIEALPGTRAAQYPALIGADYLRSRFYATYEPETA